MLNETSWSRLHVAFLPVIVLLFLVWITPAATEPTSHNDPFRALALRSPRQPDPPVCCLKPLPSLEPVEDDLLVSFEEWKARQRLTSENASSSNPPSNGSNRVVDGSGDGSVLAQVEDTASPPLASEDQQAYAVAHAQDASLQHLPHPRVPLIDRFDYASLECSARVHKAHKGAKHPSNVLSSKKDRYMLSPCKTNGEKQFIVIELCEDIRIDTVQLANFEFFSGVFKDFTVSVAKTSWKDDSEEGWTVAGTYKAKNVRGVQSFHPPTSLRGFYRYLRIDFHSHYGSEYYCPVSLVRVFGLTHLEEWKWELWEAESKAKLEATLNDVNPRQTIETLDNSGPLNESSVISQPSRAVDETQTMPSTQIPPISEIGNEATPSATMPTQITSLPTETHLASPTTAHPSDLDIVPSSSLVAPSCSISTTSTHISLAPHPSTDPPNNTTLPTIASHNGTKAAFNGTTSTTIVVSPSSARTSSSSFVVTASPLAATQSTQSFLPIPISGGESIYRMIMNRLVGLERNHTLYEQYMAQQQQIVREALKRLGEDIGRLEGLSKAQRQAHDRTVTEWEKQRKQWQMEHAQLLQRIDYLSDEIIMEKRLGVAQLCLLLAVLVFMGLTRGSRGPVVEDRYHWRSTLKSLSGDWRRPRPMKSKETHGQRAELAQGAPMTIVPLVTMDSGSGQSFTSTDIIPSPPPRYPLANIDVNSTRPQGQSTQDHRHTSSIVEDNTGTPSRTCSRRTSRSRTRTLSWQGRGVLFHSSASASRQSLDPHGHHVSRNGVPIITPSKGPRVAGVYSPRPTFGAIRSSTYAPNSRRPVPLQRAHSSHGQPGSFEYILDQTWTGAGNPHKSARTWARTAHLHEVKGKKKEDISHTGIWNDGDDAGVRSGSLDVGIDGNEDDVFGSVRLSRIQNEKLKRIPVKLLMLGNDAAGADTDGWESASDVGVDSIEGI